MVKFTYLLTYLLTFFECPGKVFFSIEKVLEKISEDQP